MLLLILLDLVLFWTKMYWDHVKVFFSLAYQKLVLDGTG